MPAFVFATFVANGSVPAAIRLEALVVLIATMVRPAIGLMLVALLAPLGETIVPLLGAPPVRHAETLVVAFLAGWLSVLAGEDEPRPMLPTHLANAMWMFGGVLIASVTANALQLHREDPQQVRDTLTALTHAYLLTDDIIGAHTASALLEGIAVIAAAATIARREPLYRFWLLLTMVAGGVFASAASGLLAIGVAPAATLARHLAVGMPRYSATARDVNAVASYYLLVLGVAVGLAASVRRARVLWLLGCFAMLGALMLTRSRSALIAGTFVMSAIGTLRTLRGQSRRSKYVVVLVISAGLMGTLLVVGTPGAISSLEMRGGFTQASMRFIEARPVFGIGAGRYYSLSKLVLPPRLGWIYGRENAHDYYLQIAAELGLVGAVAFGWVMGAALGAPLKRVWTGRAEGVTVGCVGGALAYLVTALTGHPFLVPETVIPFWIVLGLLVAHQAVPAVRSRWRRRTAIGFGCALLLTAPLRDGVPPVRLPPGEDGFGPWQTDDRGRPFREAEAFASLFVGPTMTAVEIPMRLGGDGRASSAIVAVAVPGSFAVEMRVGSDWSTLLVPLPGAEVLVPRQRINLAVTLAQDSAPARGKPGVDVGQIRLITAK